MSNQKECFVYIQLPHSLEIVTCGRFAREHARDGQFIGKFRYGRKYRERRDAVAIDPFHLPLSPLEVKTVKLGGVFGALRDAAPDAWGRRVIEREFQRFDFDEFDFLLQSAEDGAGALSFGRDAGPPAPIKNFNRIIDLAELRAAAQAFEDDQKAEDIPEQLRNLLHPGTSLGGARPKTVIEDHGKLWIAKFPQNGDRWNNAPVEAGMLNLAQKCGIQVPKCRVETVGNEKILLVERFDRQKDVSNPSTSRYIRHRMVSALTVLDAEDSPTDRTDWSYLQFADEIQRWSSKNKQDKLELFRRVVFNASISNLDDHPRNHAMIAPGASWSLAPAYDLTPSTRQGQDERRLAMTCGAFGRSARRDNLLSEAHRFGVSYTEGNGIIDEILMTVTTQWRSEVRRSGGTEQDCEVIASAFAYPGFEYQSDGSS